MGQYARLSNVGRLAMGEETLRTRLLALTTADAGEGWRQLLGKCLPDLPVLLFADCLKALADSTAWWPRFRLARRLQRHLHGPIAIADRSPMLRLYSLLRATWWRLWLSRACSCKKPRQLPGGGSVIAVIGPDASGKSTMVEETTRWLGRISRHRAVDRFDLSVIVKHTGQLYAELLADKAAGGRRAAGPWNRLGETRTGK